MLFSHAAKYCHSMVGRLMMNEVIDFNLPLKAKQLGLPMSYKSPYGPAKLHSLTVHESEDVSAVYEVAASIREIEMEVSFSFEE